MAYYMNFEILRTDGKDDNRLMAYDFWVYLLEKFKKRCDAILFKAHRDDFEAIEDGHRFGKAVLAENPEERVFEIGDALAFCDYAKHNHLSSRGALKYMDLVFCNGNRILYSSEDYGRLLKVERITHTEVEILSDNADLYPEVCGYSCFNFSED